MSADGERLFSGVSLLEPLVGQYAFEVVVSSSWRFQYPTHTLAEKLGALKPFVRGVTGGPVIGRYARYKEILQYCSRHHVTDWRALDDAFLEFPDGEDRLILCNPRKGVDEQNISQLKNWLQN